MLQLRWIGRCGLAMVAELEQQSMAGHIRPTIGLGGSLSVKSLVICIFSQRLVYRLGHPLMSCSRHLRGCLDARRVFANYFREETNSSCRHVQETLCV
jgi:hypothetical protein